MGFSQVVNHGTPREVTDEMFTQSRAFFTQPVAQRREVLRTQANPWGFYDRGLTKNRRDLKEIYDFGPPDGATIRPQWPQRLPRFRNAVQAYYRQNERLAYRLLTAISTNPGMSPGFLSRDFGHSSRALSRNQLGRIPRPARGWRLRGPGRRNTDRTL
jgi:isopenicillin N synthase-like dioxygenase